MSGEDGKQRDGKLLYLPDITERQEGRETHTTLTGKREEEASNSNYKRLDMN